MYVYIYMCFYALYTYMHISMHRCMYVYRQSPKQESIDKHESLNLMPRAPRTSLRSDPGALKPRTLQPQPL